MKNNIVLPIGYELRETRPEDYTYIQSHVFNILEEYGLTPEPNGVDDDLKHIAEVYKGGLFKVVCYDAKIIATFGLYRISNETAEIRKMYLDQDHRGKGIGLFMMEYLESAAREIGVKRLQLETASTMIEAISLYQKLGYIEQQEGLHTCRCDIVMMKVIAE